ncbi:MAG TPA: hypothetical protein VJY62_21680 [Bacteroidia bacterium]|nr:hypothetical protein [Bacteroidia bacterium]
MLLKKLKNTSLKIKPFNKQSIKALNQNKREFQMDTNDYTDDELKDSPLLKNMSRENPFKVPDGYFESFPTIITERITSQRSKPAWIIFLKNVFQPKYVVAMLVFAAALTSGVVYFNQHPAATDREIILSYDDLNNSNYIAQFDESDLIDAYLSGANADKSNESNTEIENYLLDNQTDISIIENEL